MTTTNGAGQNAPVFVAAFSVDPAIYGQAPDKHALVQYLALRTQNDGLKEFVVWDAADTPPGADIAEIVTGIEPEPVSTDTPGAMDKDPDATILAALEACASWFEEAPIDEIEAVEVAISKNAPLVLLKEAIAAAKAKKTAATSPAAAVPETVSIWTLQISDRRDSYLSVHGDENEAQAAAWAAVETEREGLDEEIDEKVQAREDAGDLNGAVEILQEHGVFYIDIEEHKVTVARPRPLAAAAATAA
jgi:hypothetical protein